MPIRSGGSVNIFSDRSIALSGYSRCDNLQELSCTDLEQVWGHRGGVSKDNEYSLPLPVAEFCHAKPKRNVLKPIMPLNDVHKKIFDILRCVPDSALCLLMQGRNCGGRSASELFAKNSKITNFPSEKMAAIFLAQLEELL
ncbi:hypothetical protein FQR65_LT17800 [Abscondita terminalis]|nr:hypothetical protein FQR65_LT17800 [Abscondita terminalis]